MSLSHLQLGGGAETRLQSFEPPGELRHSGWNSGLDPGQGASPGQGCALLLCPNRCHTGAAHKCGGRCPCKVPCCHVWELGSKVFWVIAAPHLAIREEEGCAPRTSVPAPASWVSSVSAWGHCSESPSASGVKPHLSRTSWAQCRAGGGGLIERDYGGCRPAASVCGQAERLSALWTPLTVCQTRRCSFSWRRGFPGRGKAPVSGAAGRAEGEWTTAQKQPRGHRGLLLPASFPNTRSQKAGFGARAGPCLRSATGKTPRARCSFRPVLLSSLPCPVSSPEATPVDDITQAPVLRLLAGGGQQARKRLGCLFSATPPFWAMVLGACVPLCPSTVAHGSQRERGHRPCWIPGPLSLPRQVVTTASHCPQSWLTHHPCWFS